jgi:uncharacterized membrane protein
MAPKPLHNSHTIDKTTSLENEREAESDERFILFHQVDAAQRALRVIFQPF